jgi:hypothetical protein
MRTLFCLAMLSACGGTQHWEKPNASIADLQQAYKGCAVSLGVKGEEAALLMGTPEMQSCMNAKGFYLVN